jgi:methanogenic corrinoid protein MtbC1
MTEFEGLDAASLAARIAALDEQAALDAVEARIAAGDDPLAIIEECQLGMRWVGEHYQTGKYFIIGGGIVDEQTGSWTGADLWADDASRGVQLIREAVAAGRGQRSLAAGQPPAARPPGA